MRENKFRAWNKTIGRYVEVPCLAKTIHKQNLNLVIEQCTGLKDRDGKLIYEGDRVRVTPDGGAITATGTVAFIDGCFDVVYDHAQPDKRDGQHFMRPRMYVKCFVVNHAIKAIGNVHDNPELLESSDDSN